MPPGARGSRRKRRAARHEEQRALERKRLCFGFEPRNTGRGTAYDFGSERCQSLVYFVFPPSGIALV